MSLLKALYGYAERVLFSTLLRKLLGCVAPMFVLVLVLAWYLARASATATSPGTSRWTAGGRSGTWRRTTTGSPYRSATS